MRDVTPNSNHQDPLSEVKKIIAYLIQFIKNPLFEISRIPNWTWSWNLMALFLVSVGSGITAGLLKFNFYRVAAGIFLIPITALATTSCLSLFLYYYFQFFEKRTESYKKIFTFFTLASVPFFLFQIVSEYLSFVSIIGFAFSSLLSIVGLCDNYLLEKKKAYKIVGFLFILVLIAWVTNIFT